MRILGLRGSASSPTDTDGKIKTNRAETRVPLSRDTRENLSEYIKGGEAWDTTMRRIMLSIKPSEVITIAQMNEEQVAWVLNDPKNISEGE
jgi:hypothetical protein